MTNVFRHGWNNATHQPFVLFVLFFYHFLWGFALYRYVASIVVPLLYRYPGELSPSAVQLFLAEGQFRIMKTDLIHPYIYVLLGLILLRALITPVLNAGIYYSLHHREMNAGYRFVQGIRELSLPFMGYYLTQFVLTLIPLIWIGPAVIKIISSTFIVEQLLWEIAPYAIGFTLYSYIIHICFVYIQFARTTGEKPASSVTFLVRYALQVSWISLVIAGLSILITIISMSISLIWAGLVALILYQIYRFISMFTKILSISTQYELWMNQR